MIYGGNRIMKAILHLWFLATLISLPTSVFSANETAEEIVMGAVDAAFSELERQIINGYYGETVAGKKKKKSTNEDEDNGDDVDKKEKKSRKDKKDKKKGGLPPGIAKKLERGGQLPPGIAKRYLPEDLEGKLPPAAEGFERIESEGKVLLVEVATGVIVDMIDTITKPEKAARNDVEDIGHKKPEASSEKTGEPEKKWWQFWK
jgi:hypothetical protein